MQDHFLWLPGLGARGLRLCGVGWIPEPPPQSLQLINMKPRAGRSWPLSCQQSAHLESHKVLLGAPRSWAQASSTPPDR